MKVGSGDLPRKGHGSWGRCVFCRTEDYAVAKIGWSCNQRAITVDADPVAIYSGHVFIWTGQGSVFRIRCVCKNGNQLLLLHYHKITQLGFFALQHFESRMVESFFLHLMRPCMSEINPNLWRDNMTQVTLFNCYRITLSLWLLWANSFQISSNYCAFQRGFTLLQSIWSTLLHCT